MSYFLDKEILIICTHLFTKAEDLFVRIRIKLMMA